MHFTISNCYMDKFKVFLGIPLVIYVPIWHQMDITQLFPNDHLHNLMKFYVCNLPINIRTKAIKTLIYKIYDTSILFPSKYFLFVVIHLSHFRFYCTKHSRKSSECSCCFVVYRLHIIPVRPMYDHFAFRKQK